MPACSDAEPKVGSVLPQLMSLPIGWSTRNSIQVPVILQLWQRVSRKAPTRTSILNGRQICSEVHYCFPCAKLKRRFIAYRVMIVFCSWQRSLVYQNRQWKSDCEITIWYKADKTAFFTYRVQFLLNTKSARLIISGKSRKKCHFRGHNLTNFTVHYLYNKGEDMIELYWYCWLFIAIRKKCEVDLRKIRSVLSGKVERLSLNSRQRKWSECLLSSRYMSRATSRAIL